MLTSYNATHSHWFAGRFFSSCCILFSLGITPDMKSLFYYLSDSPCERLFLVLRVWLVNMSWFSYNMEVVFFESSKS